jgi:hypothetical protein
MLTNTPGYCIVAKKNATDDDYTIKKDGSIDKKETDDKTDSFYKEGEEKPFAVLEKKTIEAGALTNSKGATNKNSFSLIQFPQEGEGFTSYEPSQNKYVQPEFAAVLFAAGIDWNKNHPDSKISYGDMSASNGDVPTGHPRHGWGHMLGLAVDIRYFGTDGKTDRVLTTSSKFSPNLNQELINIFINRKIICQ